MVAPSDLLAGRVLCRCGRYARRVKDHGAGEWSHDARCGGERAGAVQTAAAPPAPVAKERPGQAAEDALAAALKAAGYDVVGFGVWLRLLEVAVVRGATFAPESCVRQYPFGVHVNEPRRFRADFAFPLRMLLLEVAGMAHAAGRGKVRKDIERDGLAAALGYRVLKVSPEDVATGRAMELVRAALETK